MLRDPGRTIGCPWVYRNTILISDFEVQMRITRIPRIATCTDDLACAYPNVRCASVESRRTEMSVACLVTIVVSDVDVETVVT